MSGRASACVLGPLGLLEASMDSAERPKMSARPALQSRVCIDLRAMVHLVLEHHHEEAPAANDWPGGIDHLDAAGEPVGRRLSHQRREALPRACSQGNHVR